MPPPQGRTPFRLGFTAEPQDIDELGHVNNAVYLRWVQAVATAHWAAVAPADHQARMIWVVIRHEIDYRAAVLPGAKVTATTWVGTPQGARFDRFTEIHGADGKLHAEARTSWALLDTTTRRPMRVTADIAAPFLR